MRSVLRFAARRCRTADFFLAMVSGLIVLSMASSSFAQSPPLGPPNQTTDTFDFSSGVLIGFVEQIVQTQIAQTNASLKSKNMSSYVSELPIQYWPPYRLPTQYTDRPNEWFVKLPVVVGIQVHIPDWPDRQVYVPVDLNITCHGWQTTTGVIQVDTQPGPPSYEGGSWFEDAPGLSLIRDAVNAQIRGSFGIPAAMALALPLAKCISLGVEPGKGANDPTAAVLFNRPPSTTNGHHPPPNITTAEPTLHVTFDSLKRLVAHDAQGNILYSPTENIVLQAYADFTDRATPVLTMHENDQVSLSLAPVVLNAPLLDPLVVIANITQQAQGGPEDSAFAVQSEAMSYSPGAHTLTITKTYIVPPGSSSGPPGQTKPIFVTVPGYELNYTVAYHGPPVVKPINPVHKPPKAPITKPSPPVANPRR